MSVGLDCGASRFRSLRRNDQRLIGRQTATAYTAVPQQEAQRRLLGQARIPCCLSDDAILVLGSDAAPIAEALQLPLIPLLPEGCLPEDDPIGRQVVARLLETILPPATTPGTPATLVLPHDAGPGEAAYEFLSRVLMLRGYTPQVIPAALAVILAELGRDQFTGIGVSFGAAGASIGLASHGHLLAQARTDLGGDWIDRSLSERHERTLFDASGRQYLDLAGLTRWKTGPRRSISRPTSPEEETLRALYREALTGLLSQFRDALSTAILRSLHRSRCPVVLQGGATAIGGFIELWNDCWRESNIDLPVIEPRLAHDDNWSTVQGCLIHSELQQAAPRERRSA